MGHDDHRPSLCRYIVEPVLMNIMEIQNNGTAKRVLNRVVQKLSGLVGVDFNEVMNELT
jgi:hypothetical protein